MSLALDANDGTGLVQGPRAMARCIEKAQESGLCMTTVRGSNHYGIAGHYALMAVEAGLIGMAMTNSGSLTAPTFGAKPMLGSNPIAFAVPMGPGKDPFVLDMSTSTVSFGKIEIAQRARKPLPNGWAIDHDGYPTNDPFAMGAIMPLGGDRSTSGHKGYGLGMMVDMLCGPMGGGSTSWMIADGIRSENPPAQATSSPPGKSKRSAIPTSSTPTWRRCSTRCAPRRSLPAHHQTACSSPASPKPPNTPTTSATASRYAVKSWSSSATFAATSTSPSNSTPKDWTASSASQRRAITDGCEL